MKKLLSLLLGFFLVAPVYASGEIHALIMAIGEYQNPDANLAGVSHDIDSARIIARQMGVKDQNLRVYRDRQLNLEGMRKAFDDLEMSMKKDDQVFVYYSGHGTRSIIPEPSGERCAEGLIAADMQGFFDDEFEKRLKSLGKKASKVVVLLDACHSGGATTRAVGKPAANAEFKAKSWVPKDGEAACTNPVNVVKRSIAPATRAVGDGNNNFVYISAARDNEISLDSPRTGGLATTAWRDCMLSGAKDLDGSGALSAEEIRACSQEKINAALARQTGFAPHNITIVGNSRMTMRFAPETADPAPEIAPASPAPVPVSVASTSPAPVPVAQPAPVQVASSLPAATSVAQPALPDQVSLVAQAKPSKPLKKFKKMRNKRRYFGNTRNISGEEQQEDFGPVATLIDLYENRDDRRQVSLETDTPTLKIGQELKLTLKSSHAGYVYLFMVGSDDETFDLVFPNSLDTDNRIAAGQTLMLPRKGWALEVQGPVGVDALMAIVSETPRDFSALGMKPAGPFSVLEAKPSSARNIQVVTSGGANTPGVYGATVLEIEEVR